MATHYAIVGWDEHYEVDKENRAWKAGKSFRPAPLEYIRVAARRDWNLKVLELQDQVGEQVWFYVGVFEKLCGIVGCEPRCRREGGLICNSDSQPATRAEIARMLRISPETTERVLATLARPETRWIKAVCGPDEAASETPLVGAAAESREGLRYSAESCADSRAPTESCADPHDFAESCGDPRIAAAFRRNPP